MKRDPDDPLVESRAVCNARDSQLYMYILISGLPSFSSAPSRFFLFINFHVQPLSRSKCVVNFRANARLRLTSERDRESFRSRSVSQKKKRI